jgi:hypothetical protein
MGAPEPRAIRLVEDRWTTLRHIVEALAIIAAGAWAFYTFFYQETIKPAGEAPALAPTISISLLGSDSHRDILQISAGFHNTGRTQIDIAADAVNIWGIRYGPRDTAQYQNAPGRRTYSLTMPEASTRLIASAVELRQGAQGGLKGFQDVIEPGATTTVSNVIVVPRGKYDLLHAQIVAVPVKLHQPPVRVTLAAENGGGTTLDADAAAFEDDNDTYFSLIH